MTAPRPCIHATPAATLKEHPLEPPTRRSVTVLGAQTGSLYTAGLALVVR